MSEKYKLPLTLAIIIIIFIVGILALNFYMKQGTQVGPRTITTTSKGFTVNSKYQGEGIWDYTLKGELQTGCKDVEIITSRIETLPVTIVLDVNETSPEEIELCTQSTTPITKSGEYEAPEEASLELRVNEMNTAANTKTVTKEGFALESTFIADRNWQYTIVGTLPNPCYIAEADEIIAESFPEQVTVNLNIKAPDADKICIQQIQELKLTGEYFADEKAGLDLRVVRE